MRTNATQWSVGGFALSSLALCTSLLVGGLFMARPISAAPVGTVVIPAGSFQMGDELNDGYSNELPAHAVYVSAFYMDQYLVTKAVWVGVYQWAIAHGYGFDNAGAGKAATHPVETVSWYDVAKWCNARSEKEGLTPCYYTDATRTAVYRSGQLDLNNSCVNWSANGYRLPTEAEWEKASRGGASGRRFSWSNVDTITHSQANYRSDSGSIYDVSPTRGYHPTFNDGLRPYTSPVSYFAANGYGLYDMTGNVYEWCWDWYDGGYYNSSPGSDPCGPASSPYGVRVLRGGAWYDYAAYARCAHRGYLSPATTSDGFGFRCVRGNAEGSSLNVGLVAYYPFNGNANDATDNGYDGIVNGAVLGADRFGQPNSSYSFAGTNNWIRVNVGPEFFKPAFTFSVWVNFADFANYYPQIVTGDTYYIHCSGLGPAYPPNLQQKIAFYQQAQPYPEGGIYRQGEMITTNVCATNAWYHLCIVRSDADFKMYVNGTLSAQVTDSNRISLSGSYLSFGSNPLDSGQYSSLHGSLDDIRIYNRALSAFEIQALYGVNPGVSASLSQALVSPGSVPADGQSAATVTVTLVDGNGTPVVGKGVSVSAVEQLSAGGVATLSSVTQPASPTDSNGRATATVTSARAGTAIISVRDVTDGVVLARQPTVQFGSALVPPAADLANAIVQLANSSSNLLTHSIAGIATDEGGYGDWFQSQLTADKREQGVNALATGLGAVFSLLPLLKAGGEALGSGGESLWREVAKDLGQDYAPDALSLILDTIAGSSTGLTRVGQKIDGNNAALQQAELQSMQQLLAGVPPGTASYLAAYQNDVALRAQANNELRLILLAQRGLLLDLQQNSEVGHAESDLLGKVFKDINVVVIAAGTIVTLSPVGGKAAMTALGVAEGLDTYAVNQQNLINDQQGYNTAVISLANCYYLSSLVDGNTKAALHQIAQGQEPVPVTGTIVSADSVKTYEPLSGIFGDLTTWAGEIFANTEYVHVDNAYSLVTIRNTSSRAAAFMINAFYSHTFALSDPLGIHNISIVLPMVSSVVTNIGEGQSVVARVDYYPGSNGALPDDGSPITLQVLGSDGNGGLFAVDQITSAIRWQRAGGGGWIAGARPMGGAQPKADDGATNMFGLETPIKAFVFPNPTNQIYQGQIWVVNPFAIPLLATVAQPLPPGATVVSTDGSVGGGWIVWTNTIATNGVVEHTFGFTLSVSPGAETNLPPPTVVFTDGTGTNSLTMTAVAAGFRGLLPVGVNGFVPAGRWGVDTAAQLTVTNFTAVSQAGALVISLTDTNGTVVTNFSLSVSVGGLAGVSLNYSLPGTLAPGSYAVRGVLSMGGGSGQVFSGTYVLSAAPAWFGWGPGTGVLPDGFALELQGTAGYGYLIQASTNLVDWQPAQYLVLTNGSGYFTDYYAPYNGQRFYRAVAASQGQ